MSEKSNLSLIEENVQKLWAKEKTYENSVKNRQGQELYSFYDGPPFANGLPHFGHSLVTSIKDSVLRYKTMRGYYVPRRNGWDCHGLPVEFAIEKEVWISFRDFAHFHILTFLHYKHKHKFNHPPL